MSMITTKDSTKMYYKDWGTGQPVVFSHGWPLSADAWESQMVFLASNGYRCIAHDRRGHGRSSQPWDGNDMDTYADDLSALIETLALKGVVLIGFSAGGGEVARYVGRHGTTRVAKAALISAVPPLMLKTAANPDGLPMKVFDGLRLSSAADRSQFYRDLASGPFFGANRPVIAIDRPGALCSTAGPASPYGPCARPAHGPWKKTVSPKQSQTYMRPGNLGKIDFPVPPPALRCGAAM